MQFGTVRSGLCRQRHPSWDLNLPVGVIDARRSKPKLMVSAIGTINSTLKASSTIAHPLMVRLFERFEDVGLEQALTEMKRGEDGEAFCEVWEASQTSQNLSLIHI